MIAPDVMSSTGYIQTPPTIREKLHLWDYPQELWGGGGVSLNQPGGL